LLLRLETLLQLLHHLIDAEARWPLAGREVLERRQELARRRAASIAAAPSVITQS
jgi:hypothetical protein